MKKITAILLVLAAALTALGMTGCSLNSKAQAAPPSAETTAAASVAAPTDAPTTAPTQASTVAPTMAPTAAPTVAPTEPMKPTEPKEPLPHRERPVTNTQVVNHYHTDSKVNNEVTNNNYTGDDTSGKGSTAASSQAPASRSDRLGAAYTDPKGIITFNVPQAWQDYCAVNTTTENGIYKITVRMKKLYNNESVLQGIVCLNVYDKTSNVQHGFSDPMIVSTRYEVYVSAFGQPRNLSDEEQSAIDCIDEALDSVDLIVE